MALVRAPAGTRSLRPEPRARARVSLVPLIDVLFILLVYFMVTSVYLDLDMIPASGGPELADVPEGAAEGATAAVASPLLVRLAPDGAAVLQGERLALPALEARLSAAVAERPGREVLLLPSPRAPVQALASALDVLARSGVTRSRVLRLEGTP